MFLSCSFVAAATAEALKPLAAFTLREHFGVSHGEQVVAFELPAGIDPGGCHRQDEAGREVPFQVIDGVNVDERHPDHHEITNGLTGVRVPEVYASLSDTPEAPIQGVRLRGGAWSSAGTLLRFCNSNKEGGITRVDALAVTVKERGPVRAVVEVRYAVTCPELDYGALQVRPAGPAHSTTTVTLERGQPSGLLETDTDLCSTFSFSLCDGVSPTQRRYCGHRATEARFVRTEDGSVYPASGARPNMDALVELDYSQSVEVGYSAGPNSRPRMALWNPWAVNSGWYWQRYDGDGKPDSNLMNIFAGAPSGLIGAGGSGVSIYSRLGPDAGSTVKTSLRGGDNTRFLNTSR